MKLRIHALAADEKLAALERIAEAAEDIMLSGTEYTTLKYRVMQIGHDTWTDLHEALRAAGRGGA